MKMRPRAEGGRTREKSFNGVDRWTTPRYVQEAVRALVII